MFTILFFVKSALIVAAFLLAVIFVLRRKRSGKKDSDRLRHNISLLREEKLLIHTDKKLEKKRQKLLKKRKALTPADSGKLINRSKKLGVQTGEMLLASKIQTSCK